MKGYHFFLSILAVAGAVPAAAQSTETDTGSMFSHSSRARIPEGKSLKGEKARPVIDEFGACIVSRFRMRAISAVTKLAGTPESDRAMQEIAFDQCLEEGEMKLNVSVIRASIYRALYVADYRGMVPLLRNEKIDFSQGSGLGGATESGTLLRQFADCVVRSDPAAVRTLVLTTSGTQAEGAAFAAISPQLGQCLTPGSTIKFSKLMLFGLLSEVLYRDSLPGTKQATVAALPSATAPAR